MKKRVLLLAHRQNGMGGTEKVVEKVLTNKFINKYIQFTIVVSKRELNDENWFNNCKDKIYLSNNKLINVINLFCLLCNFDGDVVLSLYKFDTFITFFARLLSRKKYLIYSWIHFRLKNNFKIKFLKFADKNLAISSGIKNALIESGISREKIELILIQSKEIILLMIIIYLMSILDFAILAGYKCMDKKICALCF
ncbi:hypothetical protein [Liquorilactobacillus vini]|uniref:hypothetical protein n=1 Tax=Liquorilactobacillus vini TaxID=238015 RepID=UPI0002DF3A77|nr:hypothetical protein [Liquorilactobacillus vini]